jgi:hypothetical protein
MNLPRLRELHAAWCNGSIRTDELTELRDMLPEVIDDIELAQNAAEGCDNFAKHYAAMSLAQGAADEERQYKRVCDSLVAAYRWCAKRIRGLN